MPMIDERLTTALREWLLAPAGSRDLQAGTDMLLRLSGNRILCQNIARHPERYATKLEYELRKYLRMRLDGMTRRDVVRMERTLLPRVAAELEAAPAAAPAVIDTEADAPAPAYEGRRADHDALPPGVQGLWENAGDLFGRMRQVYDRLLALERATPCDRYEHLRELADLDARRRELLDLYDHYDPEAPEVPAPAPAADAPEPAPTAAQVSAARKYLSTNRSKLAALAPDDPARAPLLARMQERVALIMRAGEGFDDAHRTALAALGLTFGDEDGEAPEVPAPEVPAPEVAG